jgi:hypothetical protein
MNSIIAIMILLLPGMDEPKKVTTPVETVDECIVEIAKMAAAVKANEGKEFKVLMGCQLDMKKSDPA